MRSLTLATAVSTRLTARSHSPRSLGLVDLLLTTGMRISEALGARLSDLSSDRIVIRRKGGSRAVLYLPEHTVAALRAMTETTGTELARGERNRRALSKGNASAQRWMSSRAGVVTGSTGRGSA